MGFKYISREVPLIKHFKIILLAATSSSVDMKEQSLMVKRVFRQLQLHRILKKILFLQSLKVAPFFNMITLHVFDIQTFKIREFS